MTSQASDSASQRSHVDAGSVPPLLPRIKRKSTTASSEPGPATPTLADPPSSKDVQYQIPIKRILSPADHDAFLKSLTYTLVQAWIFTLADSVRGISMASVDASTASTSVSRIDIVLDHVQKLVELHPATNTGSRFGNPSFRGFHKALVDSGPTMHGSSLGLTDQEAIREVSIYLNHAFGSEERLDYGSGHELNFLMWLLCLYRLGLFRRSDLPILTLHTFRRYLDIMRQIQSTYYLEPAGSHGVWGLDDYQFLPFLFGASQLVDHAYITPRAIHNDVVLEEEGNSYLYLNQVRWVDSVKTVKGIRWHSPMLDDISGAKNWLKVEQGMRKMFVNEILGKLPIMQHFLFGGLIPATDDMSRFSAEDEAAQADRMRHVKNHDHEPDYWGDCCGIKVPSTVAAGQEMRKRLGTAGGLRPIPFD